ncbi:MAG TPA: MFS transporter, partial [Sphingobacterium sp.]|nr:MFS transporter [Sphingobacterium sp.]
STMLYGLLVNAFGIVPAGITMVVVLSGIAIYSLTQLEESFDKDLDYLEE